MKKILFLFLFISLNSLVLAQSYQGVLGDTPIAFELKEDNATLNSVPLGGMQYDLAGTNSLTDVDGWLLVWSEEHQVSIFLRDVSENFHKPRGSVLIGTLREMNKPSHKEVQNRPTVALFKIEDN